MQPELAGTPVEPPQRGPPYRLRAVGHSLGGAMLLMYAVRRRMEGRPHHLCRLVLLTPAGMLREFPLVRAMGGSSSLRSSPSSSPSSGLQSHTWRLTCVNCSLWRMRVCHASSCCAPSLLHPLHPQLAVPFLLVLPVVVRVLALLWPGRGGAVNLPFWWLRTIAFKLAVDLQHMPGLQQLVVAIIRWVLSQVCSVAQG